MVTPPSRETIVSIEVVPCNCSMLPEAYDAINRMEK